MLTNLVFLEVKAEGAGVFDVAADFASAVAALPPGRPLEPTLRLLEEAISP